MKFGIVNPQSKSSTTVDVADINDALRAARLTLGAIDHGTVTAPTEHRAGVAIVVSELGLFVPPASQSYFSINRKLYAGDAVLYGFDTEGKTVDLPPLVLVVQWLQNGAAVETAITIGSVIRPVMGHGADVIWRWPMPRPSEAERDAFLLRVMSRSDTIVFDGDTTVTVMDEKTK